MNTETLIEVKEHDVFSFRYNEEETKKRFEPYHCFDGTLIARKKQDGSIHLVDTYWTGSDNRTFTIEKALAQGELTFICNLNDVDQVQAWQKDYYNDEDFITLFIHHGYRNQNYLKKGAQRSKEKMLQTILSRIEEAEHRKAYAENDIVRHKATLKAIEQGDLTVYL